MDAVQVCTGACQGHIHQAEPTTPRKNRASTTTRCRRWHIAAQTATAESRGNSRVPRRYSEVVLARQAAASPAQALNAAGWQALNVDDGMRGWAAAGRPMITDSGAQPFVA